MAGCCKPGPAPRQHPEPSPPCNPVPRQPLPRCKMAGGSFHYHPGEGLARVAHPKLKPSFTAVAAAARQARRAPRPPLRPEGRERWWLSPPRPASATLRGRRSINADGTLRSQATMPRPGQLSFTAGKAGLGPTRPGRAPPLPIPSHGYPHSTHPIVLLTPFVFLNHATASRSSQSKRAQTPTPNSEGPRGFLNRPSPPIAAQRS